MGLAGVSAFYRMCGYEVDRASPGRFVHLVLHTNDEGTQVIHSTLGTG